MRCYNQNRCAMRSVKFKMRSLQKIRVRFSIWILKQFYFVVPLSEETKFLVN